MFGFFYYICLMEGLRKRWGLKTNLDVLAVFCVFSVNGSVSSLITKPIMAYFNWSTVTMSPWLYYPLKILVITIVYQSLFPLTGWLFGQFKWAWNFEKKFLSRLGLGFLFKNKDKK